MTNPRDLKSLSAVISLAVLAVGFILLGLLALTNHRHQDVSGDTLLESNCGVVGNIISIVAGAIFLLAGWIYWNRSPALAGSQTNREQRRAEKK
jgi:H+/Cl- antiporter ClcA